MDGVQLFTALKLNKITNKYFDGIFSKDHLHEIVKKPALVICNTDKSNMPGKHWLLFMFKGDNVYFFDSLGKEISLYGKPFINFVKTYSSKIVQSNIPTQPKNSDLCGLLCLFFAYHICRNVPMSEIIATLSNIGERDLYHFVVKHFFIPASNCCNLVQNGFGE